MKFQMFAAVCLAAWLTVPASAQDEAAGKKKGKRGQQNVAAQMIKQLEKVSLTDEQIAKVKEMGKAAAVEMKAITEESGLTPELVKKRGEAMKEVRQSGKKGKEMTAAVNEAAGLTEAQAAAFAKLGQARQKFQKSVVAMLTDEQKENLPQAIKRMAGGNDKGKGKKKDPA